MFKTRLNPLSKQFLSRCEEKSNQIFNFFSLLRRKRVSTVMLAQIADLLLCALMSLRPYVLMPLRPYALSPFVCAFMLSVVSAMIESL